jgi:hypothetical protein
MSATSEVSASLGAARDVRSDVRQRLRKQIAVALAAAAVGAAIIACSILIFLMRVQVAATFLGARIVFGVPVSEIDALKVLMVVIQCAAAATHGMVVAVVGSGVAFAAYLRNEPL